MTTATGWRLWFVKERLHLHDLLKECLAVSDGHSQRATALCEYDMALHRLARHAQKKIARADLVTVLARREVEL